MVRTRSQRAASRNTPKSTGVVRNPLLRKGFTPQANTLFEHGFEEHAAPPVPAPNLGGLGGGAAGSPNIDANIGGGQTLDFGAPVLEPELVMPMVLQDGEVAVLEGLQNGEFDVADIQRLGNAENAVLNNAATGFGGVVWLVMLRNTILGPIAATITAASVLVFGVSYLIGDSDAQVRNIETFKGLQEERWARWEQVNQISRADIFQYAVTDYQIKALQDAGGGYTLAKNWYKYTPGHVVTEEDVLEVEAELEAKITAAPTPPDYVPPSALDTMKNNAWKLGTIPLFFVVLLILWRRKKKRRR